MPGAPYGAGNALDFMVNNRSLLIPIQVVGVDYFELHLNCPGPNIFLWTGASLTIGHITRCCTVASYRRTATVITVCSP